MIYDHVPAQFPFAGGGRMAFVGEAPSYEETLEGRPLVGPSGKIYNAMLRAAGIERTAVLTTNVFDEQLPNNDVSNWCGSAAGADPEWVIPGSGLLKEEHRWHLDRLRRELEQVQPNIIVPLGSTALWALTGATEIATYRGSLVAASRLLPGAKLLPTYHPAFVQKRPKYYAIVIGDFLKALTESKDPTIAWPTKRLLIDPTYEETLAYLEGLHHVQGPISIDIETGWGQITCIGFAPDQHEAITVPFWDLRETDRSFWPNAKREIAVWKAVKAVCENDVPKLGQFGGTSDTFWLLRRMGIKLMNYRHDTRLLHHALYPELPKDLAFLGGSYTRQGPWKAMSKHGRWNADKRDT